MEFKHVSILLEEVIRELDIKEDGTYVDGTLGGAGHERSRSRICAAILWRFANEM